MNGISMKSASKFQTKSRCIPWLKLILSVIPSLVFGVFTVVFTVQQNSFSEAAREQEQQQMLQQRKQAVFDNCIDVISDLLISPHFNRSDVRHLRPIREKVLTALRQIDARQKRDIIFFLHTNELIRTDTPSAYRLDLHGADLTNVHFNSSATIRCYLPYLYLRGVLASHIVFSDCRLEGADFGESVMDESLFSHCFLAFSSFEGTDLVRSMFVNNIFQEITLAGALLIQSSFVNNTPFLSTNWTNTNLFRSNITSQNLFGTTPSGLKNTSVILNTRLPDGSFVIDTSQLVINGGAEKECNASSNSTKHWYANADNIQMQIHKQVENSSIYPLPFEGNCYFIANNIAFIRQLVDVRRFSTFIDSGQASSVVSAYFGCSQVHQSDEVVVALGYLDADYLSPVNGPDIRTNKKPFEFQSKSGPIPIGTRTIVVYLGATIIKLTTPPVTQHQYCVVDDVKLFIFNNNTNG